MSKSLAEIVHQVIPVICANIWSVLFFYFHLRSWNHNKLLSSIFLIISLIFMMFYFIFLYDIFIIKHPFYCWGDHLDPGSGKDSVQK